MRKTITMLVALALLGGFGGLAMAGDAGLCEYSHKKQQADVKTDKTKPVASKTDKADSKLAVAVADKTQPAKEAQKN